GVINHPAILDESGNEIEPERIETIEKLVLDTNPLMMDAIGAIQVLSREMEEIRRENTELRNLLTLK
ncbi:TPA: tail fiber domain-containing protein, partial [Klebsiella quasipneumoniae subsp. similipneumoniae]